MATAAPPLKESFLYLRPSEKASDWPSAVKRIEVNCTGCSMPGTSLASDWFSART